MPPLSFTEDVQKFTIPMKIRISYAIPVCNESRELDLLLDQLLKHLNDEDEIVIQGDQGNVSDEVVSVIRKHHKNTKIKYHEYPLQKDFSSFKNYLISQCSGDYIFQIDADELVSETLLENLKFVLFENPSIEVYTLPRLNIVIGLEDEWIQKWGWNKKKMNVQKFDYSTKGILEKYGLGTEYVYAINWSDNQSRLFKNIGTIRWVNKVHERLVGMNTTADLPNHDFDYCLFHVKHETRQKKQNEFYNKI